MNSLSARREQIPSPARDSAPAFSDYVFWPLLLLAGLAGLLIRVKVGRATLISFDEWQHVFMASSARWTDLAFELRTNAHPPLFFLLLGGIVKLGHVALYRSISIAAGVGSIILVGLIARRTLRSQTMQLVCAAAFAFSADAISISVQIRSYQLAVFLTLAAFLSWLAIFARAEEPAPIRSCASFAICSSLAVFCHYSAVFFLGACIAVPLVFLALSPQFRERWISAKRRKSAWLAALSLATPCAVFAIEYIVHVRKQVMQGYVEEFYFGGTPGERAGSYIIRNARNFLNLFSPVELHNASIFLVCIVVLFAVAAWILFRQRRLQSGFAKSSAAPILFAIVVTLELIAAALGKKYPFGGLLRHQYIAGPFLLMAAFVIVDALVALAGPILRRIIPALLMAGVVANLVVEWPKLIEYPGEVILRDEFLAWRKAFSDTHAVYVDHWGVIGYFIHTSERPRHFVRRIPDDVTIDQYHIADGTPQGTEIFYDKTRDLLNLRDPTIYQSFAACLRAGGVKQLSLFYFSPDNTPLTRISDDVAKLVRETAAEEGLITTKVVVGETSLSAGFKLRE